MDGVLVDPDSALPKLSTEIKNKYKDNIYDAPGFFALMDPMHNAIDSYKYLCQKFDTYILTAAPWNNPTAANDKIDWVQKYLNDEAFKRVIISHNKNLNSGDFLIDDKIRNGVDKFKGTHIHFGSEKFPNWKSVVEFLDDQA
tara:strand:+ start:706 stop:1131 length:426 start_codon:yes stop_codon:yes gene_type:complete